MLGEENRRTVLKNTTSGEELAVNEDTFEVLDCDEFRAFWLSWTNTYVYKVCISSFYTGGF